MRLEPYFAFDRCPAEVSPVLRHRFPALLPASLILHSCHGRGLYQVSSPIQLTPTTLQWSLQMHIRHTADRFRLIAHIEKEPTDSPEPQAGARVATTTFVAKCRYYTAEYAYVHRLKPYNHDAKAIFRLMLLWDVDASIRIVGTSSQGSKG